MKLPHSLFTCIDWEAIDPTCHAGQQGTARWRSVNVGDLRIRMVDYSPGYVGDHWCSRGHVVLVMEGSITSELADGSKNVLSANMGYVVSDNPKTAHRSSTERGARLFIVD